MLNIDQLQILLEDYGEGDAVEFIPAVKNLVLRINEALHRVADGKGKPPSKVDRERLKLLAAIDGMDRRLRHWIIERDIEAGQPDGAGLAVLHRLAGILREPIPGDRVWFDDDREVAMNIVAAFCLRWGLDADVLPGEEGMDMSKYTGFFQLMEVIKPQLAESWDTYKLLPIFRPKLAQMRLLADATE